MYSLFRGFVETINKQSIRKFKNVEKLPSLKDVRHKDSYAGILNYNTVLIDIDDQEESERLFDIVEDLKLNCRVYQTTRGKHFLFLNDENIERNGNKLFAASGFICDVKIGSKNSYSVLKQNGVERDIIYDICPDDEYQTIPKWLVPIRTKNKPDFSVMKEGDGRNQELFNYILILQNNNFSKDEIRECIRIINTYVLPESLDEKEIETILRDESFLKESFFDSKGRFLHSKFGDFLIAEHKIIRINGKIHYFSDGVYVSENIESLMLRHLKQLRRSQRQEAKSYIEMRINQNTLSHDQNYIAFKNGLYNLKDKQLEDFKSDVIVTNKIPHDYNQRAEPNITDDVLNRLACGNHAIVDLLAEVIGYLFFRRNELRKAFMLLGPKHNGKSTFIFMLQTMLGADNYSTLDIEDFNHEYKAAECFSKLANLGDDINDNFIRAAGTFKKIVSGDAITVNIKYENPVKFNPYCKLIFSGNTIPRLGKGYDADAIIDRLIIIPFNADFSKQNTSDFDPFIKDKLRTEKAQERLIKIGIDGLHRVLKNNSFTIPDQSKDELEEYEKILNPTTVFIELNKDRIVNHSTQKIYDHYKTWCIDEGIKAISHAQLSRIINKELGLETMLKRIDGKPTRIFAEKERK